MGLFDRLLNNAARNVLKDTINNLSNNSSTTSTPAPQPQYTPAPAAAAPVELTLEQKLDQVLASDFAGYQVTRNVSPRTMGDNGANTLPYSYVISSAGQVKLLIMVCYGNTCSKRGYRFSKTFAQNQGYTLINFLVSCPNEISYIRDRLHQYL